MVLADTLSFEEVFNHKKHVKAGGKLSSGICDNDGGQVYVQRFATASPVACLLGGSAGGVGETIVTLKTFAVRWLIPWQLSLEISKPAQGLL